jgi:hypothetical protein
VPPAMALASLLSLSSPHASSRVLGSTSSKRRMTCFRHRCERNFPTIHRRVKTESSRIHVVSYHKARSGPRMLTRNGTGVMTHFRWPRSGTDRLSGRAQSYRDAGMSGQSDSLLFHYGRILPLGKRVLEGKDSLPM